MEDLLFEINETARLVRRAFDKRAAELGVTRAQWRVLARLKREPGLRQVDLAERLDMEPITLCRIVDRLADAGLVQRKADPADRRAWRIELTADAEPLVGQLRLVARALAEDALETIGESGCTGLREQLSTIRDNIGRCSEQRGKAARA